MMWLILIMLIAAIIIFLRKNQQKETMLAMNTISTGRPADIMPASLEPEEDELLAVIAAALAEFEGTDQFTVVSIRANNRTWRLTGRQESMRNGR